MVAKFEKSYLDPFQVKLYADERLDFQKKIEIMILQIKFFLNRIGTCWHPADPDVNHN